MTSVAIAVEQEIRKLLCPDCAGPLEETRRRGVVVWACGDRDGCAVELTRLREVADRLQIEQLLQRARSPGAAWGKPCPRCRKQGREGRVRDARRLYVLDWCEACQVLWFDVSELEGVVRGAEAPPEETSGAPPAREHRGSGSQRRPRRSKRPPRGGARRVVDVVVGLGIEALLALLGGIVEG